MDNWNDETKFVNKVFTENEEVNKNIYDIFSRNLSREKTIDQLWTFCVELYEAASVDMDDEEYISSVFTTASLNFFLASVDWDGIYDVWIKKAAS